MVKSDDISELCRMANSQPWSAIAAKGLPVGLALVIQQVISNLTDCIPHSHSILLGPYFTITNKLTDGDNRLAEAALCMINTLEHEVKEEPKEDILKLKTK